MKKVFTIAIYCFLILLIFFPLKVRTSASDLNDFQLVSENQYLQLFINEQTTEIVVKDKKTDKLWFSNPHDRGNSGRVNSQFWISYFTPGDNVQFMNNFDDSVEYDQYKIIKLNNGIRIEYRLGEEWNDEDYLPVIINQKDLESVLKNIKKDDKNFVIDNYKLINLEKINNEVYKQLDITGVEDLTKIFGNYKLTVPGKNLSKNEQEEYIKLLLDTIVENRNNVNNRADIKPEDVEPLKENPTYILKDDLWAFDIEDMIKIYKNSGYNPNELQIDYLEYGFEISSRNQVIFNITLEYILDGENLVVRIPGSEIKYPMGILADDGRKVNYPITNISILDFFDAASKNDKGYMFVPDGSGALINLNNGKAHASSYTGNVYGVDYAVRPINEKRENKTQIYLPVYGMKKNNKAFLVIIEKGDALAKINADIVRDGNSFNYVSSNYTIINYASENLEGWFSDRSINIYQARSYQEDIQLRFSFLTGDKANYVGMAKAYQNYLKEKYNLNRIKTTENVPLSLEIIGAIDVDKPILGMTRKTVEPLTSYSDIIEITKEIKNRGINNLNLRFSGWLEGGLRHYYPDQVKLEEKLGTEKSFTELIKSLDNKNVNFFPHLSLLNVYRTSLFDDFDNKRDSSRYVNRRFARLFEYEPATYTKIENKFSYILSPRKLDSLVKDFFNSYQEYNLEGVFFNHLGNQVNSDYIDNPQKLIDRQQAVDIIKTQLKKISEEYLITLNGANAYVLPFVNNICNLPVKSNRYDIFDQDIPFLQIVINGFINYSGAPINLNKHSKDFILKHIEMGMNPYFQVFYQENEVVKNTDYHYLYMNNYHQLLDEIIDIYKKFNDVLGSKQDQVIVNHQRLRENIYQTTYEDGDSIIVNYNNIKVTVNNLTVDGKDFEVIEGRLKIHE